MRPLLFVLGIIVLATGPTAPASAQSYPWCAAYNAGDEAWNCGFVSYQQCMATVSGVGGICTPNTQYSPARPGSRRSN